MTREEAIQRMKQLLDDYSNDRVGVQSTLIKFMQVYLADLEADDQTTDLSANKAHDN